MSLHNTKETFGWCSIGIHWVSAMLVLIIYVLGLWMSDLDYYHAWYNRSVDLHTSLGLVLFVLTLMRILWLLYSPSPKSNNQGIIRALERLMHATLYGFLFILSFSGYMLYGSDRPVPFFHWFYLPPFFVGGERVEEVHEFLADVLMLFASLHAMASLWHHFVVGDGTLKRMFQPRT